MPRSSFPSNSSLVTEIDYSKCAYPILLRQTQVYANFRAYAETKNEQLEVRTNEIHRYYSSHSSASL